MLSCQQEGSNLLCNDDHMGSHGCPHARSHICAGLNRPGSAEAKNRAAMTLFVVTGYSHFPGCPENPTESLVNRLKEELLKSTQHCLFVLNKTTTARCLTEMRRNDVDNVTRLAKSAAIRLRGPAYKRCLPGPATPASYCVQGVSRLWYAKYFQCLRSL